MKHRPTKTCTNIFLVLRVGPHTAKKCLRMCTSRPPNDRLLFIQPIIHIHQKYSVELSVTVTQGPTETGSRPTFAYLGPDAARGVGDNLMTSFLPTVIGWRLGACLSRYILRQNIVGCRKTQDRSPKKKNTHTYTSGSLFLLGLFLQSVSLSNMAESEVDTPSTPIEYESKYFEHHGVRLPPFCRGKMEEIANFSLRSSDIWIVTYPKSGRLQGPEAVVECSDRQLTHGALNH